MSIHFDYSGQPAKTRQHWAAIQSRIFKSYRDVGLYMFEVQDVDDADILWSWRNGRGWIGLAEYFGTSCWNQAVLDIDPGWVASDFVDGQSGLGAHEVGHSCNEGHQAQSQFNTMSPTIAWPGDFVGWDSRDATTPRLKAKFSGDYGPMPPYGPPDPEPPEPPSDLAARVEQLSRDQESLRELVKQIPVSDPERITHEVHDLLLAQIRNDESFRGQDGKDGEGWTYSLVDSFDKVLRDAEQSGTWSVMRNTGKSR